MLVKFFYCYSTKMATPTKRKRFVVSFVEILNEICCFQGSHQLAQNDFLTCQKVLTSVHAALFGRKSTWIAAYPNTAKTISVCKIDPLNFDWLLSCMYRFCYIIITFLLWDRIDFQYKHTIKLVTLTSRLENPSIMTFF